MFEFSEEFYVELGRQIKEARIKNMKRYIKNIEVPQEVADYVANLEAKTLMYEKALSLIAAPERADGTFNRCREACQRLAEQALTDGQNFSKKNVDNQN